MPGIGDLIGERFEDFFMEHFPGFEDRRINKRNESNVPDFYNPQFGFWVETKVGNLLWGVRLKEYQMQSFGKFQEPVVYCLGLHNFNHAQKKLWEKCTNTRKKILQKEMGILEVYFLTQEVIRAVWNADKRLNDKSTIEYCTMKRHTIQDILLNRKCKRQGIKIEHAREYYGLGEELEYSSDINTPPQQLVRGLVLMQTLDDPIKRYLQTFMELSTRGA